MFVASSVLLYSRTILRTISHYFSFVTLVRDSHSLGLLHFHFLRLPPRSLRLIGTVFFFPSIFLSRWLEGEPALRQCLDQWAVHRTWQRQFVLLSFYRFSFKFFGFRSLGYVDGKGFITLCAALLTRNDTHTACLFLFLLFSRYSTYFSSFYRCSIQDTVRQRNSVSGRMTLRRPSFNCESPKWENEKLDRTELVLLSLRI